MEQIFSNRSSFSGDKKRRDVIQCIRIIPALDGYLAASQKGAICIWSSKVGYNK
jgi:hypothetical protein